MCPLLLLATHQRDLSLSVVISHLGNGYLVLLAVCSAICSASVGCILPICMGQNMLVNEWIILCHSFVNEWVNFL